MTRQTIIPVGNIFANTTRIYITTIYGLHTHQINLIHSKGNGFVQSWRALQIHKAYINFPKNTNHKQAI